MILAGISTHIEWSGPFPPRISSWWRSRGIASRAQLLLLDEPTSSLNAGEAESLIGHVRTLAANGISTIFVSHQLDEVFDLVDSFAVLRDGRVVLRCRKEETDRSAVVSAMIGTTASKVDIQALGRSRGDAAAQHAFEVRSLTRPGSFDDISFTVAPGEVVGLTGLRGCGAVEVAASIFHQTDYSGQISRLGHLGPLKMSELIRIGIGYVPADRGEGLFPDLSVRENLGLAARIGHVPASRTVEEVMKLLAIRAHDLRDPVKELSGGNQQKVLIGRWLVTAVKALILVEPTRGVDIGVRVDIHRLIRELADIGVGVLLASLDTEEIEAVANRVLVMHNGRIYTELEGKITVSKVRTAVAGVASTKAVSS